MKMYQYGWKYISIKIKTMQKKIINIWDEEVNIYHTKIKIKKN